MYPVRVIVIDCRLVFQRFAAGAGAVVDQLRRKIIRHHALILLDNLRLVCPYPHFVPQIEREKTEDLASLFVFSFFLRLGPVQTP